jgi:hypothetical protein
MTFKKKDETPAYNIDDRGFNVKAWYPVEAGDALIHISHDGKLVREFLYPAYKIWNIAAHFHDIVDGELSKDDKERGYLIAGSDGLGGCVLPRAAQEAGG